MIKGLFETHLYVENLERSIEFYTNVLKLEQFLFEEERRAALFWIRDKPKQSFLGLWEKPKDEIDLRHFAHPEHEKCVLYSINKTIWRAKNT